MEQTYADPDPTHPLVDVHWLAAHLTEDGVTVLDASNTTDHPGVRIPGARRFDLEGAFSDPASPLPHTQPTPEAFEAEARRLGVAAEGTVVVYDLAELFSAARAWWLFRAMGHERVAVLDGGLAAWQAAGFALEPVAADEATRDDRGTFEADDVEGLLVDADAVAAALASDDPGAPVVVDARSHARFTGAAAEPRPGLRSGHMPGARNIPYQDVQHDGHLLPTAQLSALIDPVLRDRPAIVSCGSGVTACVTALAALLCGHHDVAVYDGSWTEWGDPASGRPVVTGEE